MCIAQNVITYYKRVVCDSKCAAISVTTHEPRMKLLKISLYLLLKPKLTVRPRSMNHMDVDALSHRVYIYLFRGLVLQRAYRDGQERIHHSLLFFFSFLLSIFFSFVFFDVHFCYMEIIRCIFSVSFDISRGSLICQRIAFDSSVFFILEFYLHKNHKTLTRLAPF